jgi:hypothetical protein
MTTNLELVTKIQRYLYEPTDSNSPQLITTEMVLDFYNMAIDELCLETDINYRQYLYTEATSALPTSKTLIELTGNVETHLFSLSELLIKETEEEYYRVLYKPNMEEKLNITYDSTDWVIACNIYDDSVKFTKGLDSGDVVAISGRWKKALQTTSGDFPLHPMGESAVVYFAIANGCYVKGDIATGDKWFSLFVNRKGIIKNTFEKLVKANAPHAVRAIPMENQPMKSYGSVINLPSVITV